MYGNDSSDCGEILRRTIKRRRLMKPLTFTELAVQSGVSPSYLSRIERGERFPSARILQKIAGPLDFNEDVLFGLAGYLSPPHSTEGTAFPEYYRQLDPDVARVLAEEPVDTQRSLIEVLYLLRGVAKNMTTKYRNQE